MVHEHLQDDLGPTRLEHEDLDSRSSAFKSAIGEVKMHSAWERSSNLVTPALVRSANALLDNWNRPLPPISRTEKYTPVGAYMRGLLEELTEPHARALATEIVQNNFSEDSKSMQLGAWKRAFGAENIECTDEDFTSDNATKVLKPYWHSLHDGDLVIFTTRSYTQGIEPGRSKATEHSSRTRLVMFIHEFDWALGEASGPLAYTEPVLGGPDVVYGIFLVVPGA